MASVCSSLEEIVGKFADAQIHLVPRRDDVAEPDPAIRRPGDIGPRQTAALRDEPDPPHGEVVDFVAGDRGEDHVLGHVHDSRAIRADDADPRFADLRLDPLLGLLPLFAALPEAGGMDDDALDPFLDALLDNPGHRLRGDLDKRRIHRFGKVLHRGETGDARDFGAAGIHRVEFPGIAILQNVFDRSARILRMVCRRPHDDERFRRKQIGHLVSE